MSSPANTISTLSGAASVHEASHSSLAEVIESFHSNNKDASKASTSFGVSDRLLRLVSLEPPIAAGDPYAVSGKEKAEEEKDKLEETINTLSEKDSSFHSEHQTSRISEILSSYHSHSHASTSSSSFKPYADAPLVNKPAGDDKKIDISQNDPKFSAEELRQHLYHTFKQKGVIGKLKSQLRNQLITELHHGALRQPLFQSAEEKTRVSLMLRTINSVVANHLEKYGYNYTLSVFLPEAGLMEKTSPDSEEILSLLGVHQESRFYQALISKTGKGMLWEMLVFLCRQHAMIEKESQTELEYLDEKLDLDKKLSKLELLYDGKKEEEGLLWMASIQERMLAFQRELQERYRTEMDLEIARFKETELAQMRILEKDKCRKELSNSRKEMDRLYQAKFDALVARERNTTEKLHREQEILEKETYSQRQSILTEIETLRKREGQLKRDTELQLRAISMEEDKLKAQEGHLRSRETTVRNQEVELQKRVEQELTRYRLQDQEQYAERNQKLETGETRLKEEMRRIEDDRKEMKRMRQELREKSEKIGQLEVSLFNAKSENVMATANAEALKEKVRETVDYKQVREDYAGCKKLLENTQHRLAEVTAQLEREESRHREVLKDLTEKLAQPSPEALLLQTELEAVRATLKQEKTLAEFQKQQLQDKLKAEVARFEDLLRKFEEQSRAMRLYSREMEELQNQLRHTQAALSKDVSRKYARSRWSHRNREALMETTYDEQLFAASQPADGQRDAVDDHLNMDVSQSSDSSLQFLLQKKEGLKLLTGIDKDIEKKFREERQTRHTLPLHEAAPYLRRTAHGSPENDRKKPDRQFETTERPLDPTSRITAAVYKHQEEDYWHETPTKLRIKDDKKSSYQQSSQNQSMLKIDDMNVLLDVWKKDIALSQLPATAPPKKSTAETKALSSDDDLSYTHTLGELIEPKKNKAVMPKQKSALSTGKGSKKNGETSNGKKTQSKGRSVSNQNAIERIKKDEEAIEKTDDTSESLTFGEFANNQPLKSKPIAMQDVDLKSLLLQWAEEKKRQDIDDEQRLAQGDADFGILNVGVIRDRETKNAGTDKAYSYGPEQVLSPDRTVQVFREEGTAVTEDSNAKQSVHDSKKSSIGHNDQHLKQVSTKDRPVSASDVGDYSCSLQGGPEGQTSPTRTKTPSPQRENSKSTSHFDSALKDNVQKPVSLTHSETPSLQEADGTKSPNQKVPSPEEASSGLQQRQTYADVIPQVKEMKRYDSLDAQKIATSSAGSFEKRSRSSESPLDDPNIDPVMKKYMAMVMQQREKEAQTPEKETEAAAPHSELSDLVLDEDISLGKSENDDFW